MDVPDFTKERVSVSGVVLSATRTTPPEPADALRGILPVVPTTAREFKPSDSVVAFVRVYQGGKDRLKAVTVRARIVDSRGATAFDFAETFGPDRFSAVREADYRLGLPLGRLAAGPHLLTITAIAGRDSAQRDVPFNVRVP